MAFGCIRRDFASCGEEGFGFSTGGLCWWVWVLWLFVCSGLGWLFRAFWRLCFGFWCFVSFDEFYGLGMMQKFLIVWGLECLCFV